MQFSWLGDQLPQLVTPLISSLLITDIIHRGSEIQSTLIPSNTSLSSKPVLTSMQDKSSVGSQVRNVIISTIWWTLVTPRTCCCHGIAHSQATIQRIEMQSMHKDNTFMKLKIILRLATIMELRIIMKEYQHNSWVLVLTPTVALNDNYPA